MYHGEKFNAVSHFLGGLIASAGAAVLITLASLTGDAGKITGVSVYGVSMVLVYAASTLYHSTPGPAKSFLRTFDHVAIYLMIAGTYTPFCLITLRGSLGNQLLAAVWALAMAGALYDMLLTRKNRWLSIALYFLMGSLALTALGPLYDRIPGHGFSLLLIGGLLYLAGFFFFIFDEQVPHFHGIWHLFVIAASACQYFCVLACVVG